MMNVRASFNLPFSPALQPAQAIGAFVSLVHRLLGMQGRPFEGKTVRDVGVCFANTYMSTKTPPAEFVRVKEISKKIWDIVEQKALNKATAQALAENKNVVTHQEATELLSALEVQPVKLGPKAAQGVWDQKDITAGIVRGALEGLVMHCLSGMCFECMLDARGAIQDMHCAKRMWAHAESKAGVCDPGQGGVSSLAIRREAKQFFERRLSLREVHRTNRAKRWTITYSEKGVETKGPWLPGRIVLEKLRLGDSEPHAGGNSTNQYLLDWERIDAMASAMDTETGSIVSTMKAFPQPGLTHEEGRVGGQTAGGQVDGAGAKQDGTEGMMTSSSTD